MNMELTTAAKKPQPAYESASAVYVITQEDIRRSGAVNLPEALRMAPGIQVMRSDPGDFAVTSRGFLGEWANKLLVLVDGRSIYSPFMSGVFWEYNDMLLEDIERIEVIRGPGATLWGANAVNGVINIITKHARDTQGGMAVAAFSNQEGYDGFRYGAKAGEGMYVRAYGKYASFDGVVNNKQTIEPRQVRGGMRLDWDMSPADTLLVTADYYDGREKTSASRIALIPPPVLADAQDHNNFAGGSALARWSHAFSATSDLNLQIYYDGYNQRAERSTGDRLVKNADEMRNDAARLDTCDIDLQHTFAPADRHSIIWGLNARRSRLYKRDVNWYFRFNSETETQRLYSAFVQDEIELLPERLRLIVGSKFEYNSSTQLEVQPSIRMLYTPSEAQSFWWAVSKAARTPSAIESKGRIRSAYVARSGLFPLSPPALAELQGNRDYGSESLIAYEAGHRVQLAQKFSLDTAFYYNFYDDLRTLEPSSPQVRKGYFFIPVKTDNNMRGRSYGAEMAATWQALPHWRLQATGTHMRLNLTPRKDSRDTLSEYDEDLSSQNLLTLRSLYSITPTLECDISLYFADAIQRLNNPSHTDLTVRLGWKPFKHLMLEGIGYNLIDNKYKGFRDERYNRGLNEVYRMFYGRITVEF
jgi:iron complex outermembrane receptor protein